VPLRVQHNFPQTANGCNLTGCKPLDKFVNLLLFVRRVRWREGEIRTFILPAVENAETKPIRQFSVDAFAGAHAEPAHSGNSEIFGCRHPRQFVSVHHQLAISRDHDRQRLLLRTDGAHDIRAQCEYMSVIRKGGDGSPSRC
jgi:hypothetical protein